MIDSIKNRIKFQRKVDAKKEVLRSKISQIHQLYTMTDCFGDLNTVQSKSHGSPAEVINFHLLIIIIDGLDVRKSN